MKQPIFIFCLLILSAPLAYSCSFTIHSHARGFREAKAIFIGTVIEVSLNDSDDSELRKLAPYKIKLRVEKKWKGDGSEITIISDDGEPPCGGFKFREGERYLVYAFGKEMFAESWGSRNRPIEREDEYARKELKQLDSLWFRWKARLWRF